MRRCKNFIVLSVIFIILIKPSFAVFCCRDPETYQSRCYNTGQCCNNLWYQLCINFEVWSRGGELGIGKPTPVNVYIRNIGAYPDEYNLNYKIIKGHNVIVDTRGHDKISVDPNGVRVLRPTVIILAQTIEPIEIEFNVSSTQNKTLWRTTTVRISAEEYLYSMSEFPTFLLIMIILLANIFYRKV
uniref:CARDB domain-containing protein n=1 Tax=candidate division CPR3 bacterium TaxID=2268181 RepID=A0A7C5YWE6_UNCC3